MINPDWFEVLGVRLACIEIQNPRGGQYSLVNRSQEWLEEWLGVIEPRAYVSSECIRSSLGTPKNRIEELVYEVRGQRPPWPYDRGQILGFQEDPWVNILIYGYDTTPERAWEANPIRQLFYYYIPFKTKRQRKIERKGGAMQVSSFRVPRRKLSGEVLARLPLYNRETSLHYARETTWSIMGTPLVTSSGNAHLFTGFPSRYQGSLWIAPDGWARLHPESTTEFVKMGLSKEDADQYCENHRLLLQEWLDKKRAQRMAIDC